MSGPPITFIACVEPGSHRLEYKAATLFLTMRRNLGALAGASIRAYAPRPGRPVAPWLRELMDHFSIDYVDEPINAAHADYALANKPLALAHAEATAKTEFVVFLDTDILMWSEPRAFLFDGGIDMGLVADTTKTTASAGPGDPFEEYWMRLYDLVGASARPFVTTTLTHEHVRGTWNSGVVALRRSAGIAAQWADAMERLLANDFAPAAASYLRENNVLSAVGVARFDRLLQLPVTYNYPVQNWDHMSAHGTTPEDAVLWHYQPFFDKAFHRFADRIDAARTFRDRLSLTEKFADDLRRNYRRRIGVDESWTQWLRRRARLGPRIRKLLGRSKPSDARIDG
jgi:hypothetical protein